jgi:hypothetical protein
VPEAETEPRFMELIRDNEQYDKSPEMTERYEKYHTEIQRLIAQMGK